MKKDSILEKIIDYGIVLPTLLLMNLPFYYIERMKARYYQLRNIDYHWADNDLNPFGFSYVVRHNGNKDLSERK